MIISRSSVSGLKQLQLSLASQINLSKLSAGSWNSDDMCRRFPTVAGVDVGINNESGKLKASAVLFDSQTLQIKELAIFEALPTIPYIPGYLSFRELPVVLGALNKLSELPSMILCDGQGIAHPRRFGIASHLGVELDLPTIGVAKKRLVGDFVEPSNTLFASTPLQFKDETVGLVIRTRVNVKPVFVSPGHLMSVEDAGNWVCYYSRGFKLPEPTRIADQVASSRLSKKMLHELTAVGLQHDL
ncbi:MAG: endonuclease V [Gammaproteobacteria bacterium]|nr:endonuclease V [Gammaproteobacteria bacterium]